MTRSDRTNVGGRVLAEQTPQQQQSCAGVAEALGHVHARREERLVERIDLSRGGGTDDLGEVALLGCVDPEHRPLARPIGLQRQHRPGGLDPELRQRLPCGLRERHCGQRWQRRVRRVLPRDRLPACGVCQCGFRRGEDALRRGVDVDVCAPDPVSGRQLSSDPDDETVAGGLDVTLGGRSDARPLLRSEALEERLDLVDHESSAVSQVSCQNSSALSSKL